MSNTKKPLCCIPTPHLEERIQTALKEFRNNWNYEEKVFEELCFCILTPQSSARQAIKTINLLKEHNLLDRGLAKEKEPYLKNVRFFRTKAKRLVEVQEKFPKQKARIILMENGLPGDAIKAREFLHKEVNGYGMKEASHFLRNIGFGNDIAILDRHILKNLVKCKVIANFPKTLTKNKYLEIEEKMKAFCQKHKVSFAELDLIFWSNETGEVLK